MMKIAPKWESRPYGRTGEHATVVGLGGACLNQRSYAEGVATVRRALELGVTYFDTSPAYGRGVSQRILGEALDGRSEAYLLATKLGHLPHPADFRSKAALRTQLKDSLRALRRDSVDTLQVHEADSHGWWADDASHDGGLHPDRAYDFASAPILEVLREAKAQGQCRFTGITGNNADAMARVLRHVEEVDTLLIAFHYDLIWRSARCEALPLAHTRKVALILGGVLRNGSLAEVHREWLVSPPPWMTPDIRVRFERLYRLQEACGLSLVELSIRYLLADPGITTILVGAATPVELEESVGAAHQGPLPSDLHEAVEQLGLP